MFQSFTKHPLAYCLFVFVESESAEARTCGFADECVNPDQKMMKCRPCNQEVHRACFESYLHTINATKTQEDDTSDSERPWLVHTLWSLS